MTASLRALMTDSGRLGMIALYATELRAKWLGRGSLQGGGCRVHASQTTGCSVREGGVPGHIWAQHGGEGAA